MKEVRKIKKKKTKIQVTNSHWCEMYRAFGKNNFRSKYYYLTNWTEKSIVYRELVVWLWGMKEVRKIKKKQQKSKSRIRTGVKCIELLVKIIFALSITTWGIGQRNLLSIEKGQKRTSGLTLGNERGEKNLKKNKNPSHEFALVWNV